LLALSFDRCSLPKPLLKFDMVVIIGFTLTSYRLI
jgi:hypothetical protein